MRKSSEILKEAFEKAGVKAIASELDLSAALLYKWCQDSSIKSGSISKEITNPLERIGQIYDKTGNLDIVKWLCQKAHGYFVSNTFVDIGSLDANLFRNTHKIIEEFSETLKEISECFNNDGRISRAEAADIRKDWEDLKSVGEAFIIACELGKFSQIRKKIKRESKVER